MTTSSLRQVQACVTLIALAAAAQVTAAPITITSTQFRTEASDGGTDTDWDFSTALGAQTLSSSFGGSSATTTANWQDTGSGALLDFDFAQVRAGTQSSYAFSDDVVTFTVGSSNTTYALSGQYAMTGPANRVYAYTVLQDLTFSDTIFFDAGYSDNTADESFDLGVAGDADNNYGTFGSLTGTLLAGRTYSLTFSYFIQAVPRNDSGATASGCLTLSIGGATGGGQCGIGSSVPEPASFALVGLALAGLGVARRRARRT